MEHQQVRITGNQHLCLALQRKGEKHRVFGIPAHTMRPRFTERVHNPDQAIRDEREAGRTIPELMKLTGLSYRGVYLALNRTDERNGK